MVAFAVALAIVLVRSWRLLRAGEPERVILVYTAAASSALAFALLTRMWERYLVIVIACLAPLLFRRWMAWAYAALSLAAFLSLYFHYELDAQAAGFPSLRVDPLFGWVFGGYGIDEFQKRILSLATLAVLLWVALRGWRSVRRRVPRARFSEPRISANVIPVPPQRSRARCCLG